MATTLDYTKAVITARHDNVHIYHVYKDYMNGAWYNKAEDRWVPSQWTLSGYFLPSLNTKKSISDFDLINYE